MLFLAQTKQNPMFPKLHSSPLPQDLSLKKMKPFLDCMQRRNVEDKFTLALQMKSDYMPVYTNVYTYGKEKQRII